MLVINRVAKPGEIKRLELWPDTVRLQLKNGKELHYVNTDKDRDREREGGDYGHLDAVAERAEP